MKGKEHGKSAEVDSVKVDHSIQASGYRLHFNKKSFLIYIPVYEKDAITNSIRHGSFEFPSHYGLVEKLIGEGGRILDLGAHYGTFSLRAAAMNYEIIAVEASPINASLMSYSIRKNNYNNIELIRAAVSDMEGSLEFIQAGPYGVVANPSMNVPTISVRADTVDGILEKLNCSKVDLVKIDVEGSEVSALQGMSKLIKNCSPPIILESNGHTLGLFEKSPATLLAMVESYGYHLYLIDGQSLVPTLSRELQYKVCVDYLALKNSVPKILEKWLVEPLTMGDRLARMQDESSPTAHKHARLYTARILCEANNPIKSDPRVDLILRRLRRDPDEEVRIAATSNTSNNGGEYKKYAGQVTNKVQKNRAISVSIPRSGHTLLMYVMEEYLADFHYCEYYTPPDCCKSFPCTKPCVDVQKSHDFDLLLTQDSGLRYIVQYRNPLFSSVSDFLLRQERSPDNNCDSIYYWLGYILQRRDFWRSFVQKWVFEQTLPYIILISYEEILISTLSTFSRLLKFLRPYHQVDYQRLSEVLIKYEIKPKRALREFQYFDPLLFFLVEFSLSDEMKMLGMAPVMQGNPDFQKMIYSFQPDEYTIRLIFYVFLGREPKRGTIFSMIDKFDNVHEAAFAVLRSPEYTEIKKTRRDYLSSFSLVDDELFQMYTAKMTPQHSE